VYSVSEKPTESELLAGVAVEAGKIFVEISFELAPKTERKHYHK